MLDDGDSVNNAADERARCLDRGLVELLSLDDVVAGTTSPQREALLAFLSEDDDDNDGEIGGFAKRRR